MNEKSSLIAKLAYRITVPKCVSCRRILLSNERALCAKCYSEYLNVKSRNCSICNKQLSSCFCTNDFLSTHFVKGLAKVFRYRVKDENKSANSLIFRMKKRSRKDVTDFCASELVDAIRNCHPDLTNAIVTNVPNRKSVIRERGMDHAQVLANAVADKLGLEYKHLLVSLSKRPQKSLTTEERMKNADFDIVCDESLEGKTVLIIDDVVTSGASMGKSAAMIRTLRPKQIYGAALAVAYFDNYKKSNKKG